MTGVLDEATLRPLVPAVIGVLVRRGADFAAAEDAVQEALVEAWRTFGGPDPSEAPRDLKGWLVTVAWRRFLDVVRSEAARQRRELAVGAEPGAGPAGSEDDTLRIYFLCAHPALTPASAVALAGELSLAPGAGGRPIHEWLEVRPFYGAPSATQD